MSEHRPEALGTAGGRHRSRYRETCPISRSLPMRTPGTSQAPRFTPLPMSSPTRKFRIRTRSAPAGGGPRTPAIVQGIPCPTNRPPDAPRAAEAPAGDAGRNARDCVQESGRPRGHVMGVRTWVSDWPVYRQLTGSDPLARGRAAISTHAAAQAAHQHRRTGGSLHLSVLRGRLWPADLRQGRQGRPDRGRSRLAHQPRPPLPEGVCHPSAHHRLRAAP